MAKAQRTITMMNAHDVDDINRERSTALAHLMKDIGVMVSLDENGDFAVTCADYPDVAVIGAEFQSVMREACEYIHAAIVLDNPDIDIPHLDDTGFSADFTVDALEKAKPHMDKGE